MPVAPPRSRPAGAARTAPPRRPVPPRSAPGRAGDPSRRMKIGTLLLVALLTLSLLKLITVQTFQSGSLTASSEKQRLTRLALPAERGSILDRNGTPLAFSTEASALVTNPRLITTQKGARAAEYKQQMATAVAARTGGDPNALLALLNSDRGYVVLAQLADPGAARELREAFPEIAQEKRESRQYPGGSLAANVIGAASWNSGDQKLTGLVGLESSQDALLAGTDGYEVVDTAEGSSAIIPGSTRAQQDAVPGSDIQLTIDSDIQYTIQRQLQDYVAKTNAKGGSAVVLDVKTGEVLALANGTTFDPSNLAGADSASMGNAAVTSPFEPGSVNKIVTMAAALEYGVAKPDDVLDVPGSIKVADRTVNDAWKHGLDHYTLTGVLAKSSNVGTIMTAQKVGEDRFADMLARFGLGQKTGVGLPGESAGRVPPRDTWSGSTFGNLPIGQGLSMTVLQMAGMYQAVANDGVRIPPRIVASTVGPGGVRTVPPQPEPVRVVSPQTAQTLRGMLTAVTQNERGVQRGTGAAAGVDGYQVAGKTGTAQQVDPSCGCYARSTYWITFAGMLPAQDPRFVIGIMLDAPAGGASAAPLFHDMASFIAARQQIPVGPPAPFQTLVAP
ncbi:peptidoglycan D,D-transpeptidase FtsI family protein [Pseudonocardia sulfidoxydans]|nr:penicillin-binding protein 2 [Pseudonocardia sulfidoxydans]